MASIEALRLDDLGLACAAPIDWIEVVAEGGRRSSPAQDAVAKRWVDAGKTVRRHHAVGVPFWTLQETAIAPELVRMTTELMVRS